MSDNAMIKEEENGLFYIIACIYFAAVGLSGGALNIFAMMRAIRVSIK